MVKLDAQDSPHQWWMRDRSVSTMDEFIKGFYGVQGEYVYAELYQIDKGDDQWLADKIAQFIAENYQRPVREMLSRLFQLNEGLRAERP